jgi:hypothetical protein
VNESSSVRITVIECVVLCRRTSGIRTVRSATGGWRVNPAREKCTSTRSRVTRFSTSLRRVAFSISESWHNQKPSTLPRSLIVATAVSGAMRWLHQPAPLTSWRKRRKAPPLYLPLSSFTLSNTTLITLPKRYPKTDDEKPSLERNACPKAAALI